MLRQAIDEEGLVPLQVSLDKGNKFKLKSPKDLPSLLGASNIEESSDVYYEDIIPYLKSVMRFVVVGSTGMGKSTLLQSYMLEYQDGFGKMFIIDFQSYKGQWPLGAKVVGANILDLNERIQKCLEVFDAMDLIMRKRGLRRNNEGASVELEFNSKGNRVLLLIDEYTRLIPQIEGQTNYNVSGMIANFLEGGRKLGIYVILGIHGLTNFQTGAKGFKESFLNNMDLHLNLIGDRINQQEVKNRRIEMHNPVLVVNGQYLKSQSLVGYAKLRNPVPHGFEFNNFSHERKSYEDVVDGEVLETKKTGYVNSNKWTITLEEWARNPIDIQGNPLRQYLPLPEYPEDWQKKLAHLVFKNVHYKYALTKVTAAVFDTHVSKIGGNQQKNVKDFLYHVLGEDIPKKWDRNKEYVDIERKGMEIFK